MNGEAKEPASPCVGVCKMDPATGLCRGCRRTLDEIANWTAFSTAQKSAVLERFDERQKNVKKILNSELPSKQFQAALSVPLYIEYQDVLTRPENMTGRSNRDEIVSFLRYLCSICYRQDVFSYGGHG